MAKQQNKAQSSVSRTAPAKPGAVKPAKSTRGRKSKLNQIFLKVANSVVSSENNAIIFTDEELLIQINEKLPATARISQRTFERWKVANSADKDDGLSSTGLEFCRLIKRALMAQKARLFELLGKDSTGWQRFAWILERKFKEWNIRNDVQKVALTNTAGQDVFQSIAELSDAELDRRRAEIAKRCQR